MPQFCYLYLTCEDGSQASKIAKALLKDSLIVCAKQIPIESDFVWKGKIEHSKEVLLIMESRLDLFKDVEDKVSKHHSYETFVLEAVPISEVSSAATKWMNGNLK